MKITRKEHPDIFEEIFELVICHVENKHRKRDTFFRTSIVEFKLEYSQYYPKIADFSTYIGTWMTNSYVWSDSCGADYTDIYELTKVEKKTKTVTQEYWEPVTEPDENKHP